MADTQETIADIIAEMRNDANTDEYTPDGILGQKLNYLADRLDAARKREMEAVGDCAKLREALKAAKQYLDGYTVNILELRRKVDAALAAPARNCDVGTPEEQSKRKIEFCYNQAECLNCSFGKGATLTLCALAWAQMPYESEAAK